MADADLPQADHLTEDTWCCVGGAATTAAAKTRADIQKAAMSGWINKSIKNEGPASASVQSLFDFAALLLILVCITESKIINLFTHIMHMHFLQFLLRLHDPSI